MSPASRCGANPNILHANASVLTARTAILEQWRASAHEGPGPAFGATQGDARHRFPQRHLAVCDQYAVLDGGDRRSDDRAVESRARRRDGGLSRHEAALDAQPVEVRMARCEVQLFRRGSAGGDALRMEFAADIVSRVDVFASSRGATALMEAARAKRASVARLLLDRGADASLEDCAGQTALDIARAVDAGAVPTVLAPAK